MNTTQENLNFVANVFTIVGQELMRRHQCDLIIDMPHAVECLDQGKSARLLIRPTGSNYYEMYAQFCEEAGLEVNDKNVHERCDRTTGWTVDVELLPNHTLNIRFNRTNERGEIVNSIGEVQLSRYNRRQFLDRLSGVYGTWNKVEFQVLS
jgi:hypothetical protein